MPRYLRAGGFAILASLLLILAAGCGSDEEAQTMSRGATGGANAPAPTNAVPVNGGPGSPSVHPPDVAPSPPAAPAASNAAAAAAAGAKPAESLPKNPIVVLDTSMGTIKIQLDSEKAPITTKNFLDYVGSGFYDGTVFHRVIPDFMIQGGGFTADLTEKKTNPAIKNEGGNGLQNKRGTLAMARTPDPDSATAQFFINVKDNAFLDRANSRDGFGYAVFGKVVSGMDVVDKIKAVKTETKNGMENVPATAVTIKSAKVQK